MQLFYAPNISGAHYTLSEEESKHCIRVLRMNKGDEVTLVDGKGNLFKTSIIYDNVKRCTVAVFETIQEFEKRKHYLHIAIAPTKNIERFEWFLEKATEIGIDEITPILCDHSERKVINHDRLEKIIISAMKQSVKAYLPKLNPLIPFSELVSKLFTGKAYIAHCQTKELHHLKTYLGNSSSNLILVGPEGDFSRDEVELSKSKGVLEVSLGLSRLRTETAGIIACSTINIYFE